MVCRYGLQLTKLRNGGELVPRAGGGWVSYTDYQSEKARADAAYSRLAALEAGMRGLVAKASEWNQRDRFSRENGGTRIYVSDCANELRDELSALLNRPADVEADRG